MLKCGGCSSAQAQRLRDTQTPSPRHWDWRSQGGLLEVLDVAVTVGFAFQAFASKLCFRDRCEDVKSSLFVAGAQYLACVGNLKV